MVSTPIMQFGAPPPASTVNLPMLFAGPPSPEEMPLIEQYRKDKRTIIYFLTPEEAKTFKLVEGEAGVVWTDDAFVKNFMFQHIHAWMGGQIGILDSTIGSNKDNQDRSARLASIMQDVIQLWSFDTSSAQHLFKDMVPQKNMFRNHRWIEDGAPFSAFKGKGKGIVTVLIAAGPSLDSQWEHLRRIRQNMPNAGFVVCGRSYKQAMKNGVAPEFVYEVEQFEWDDRLFLFAPEPPPATFLVGPLTACPNLFHAWPNRGQVCITWDHNYAQMMGATAEEIKNKTKSMDGGNSIIHHMFHFATHLESETVVLAGVDFAYPEGHKDTHAAGTFHMWNPEVWKTEHGKQAPMQVPCTAGGMVLGSQPYRNFATYMEIAIQDAKRRNPALKVVNFSPKGQKIEGTVYEDISTWALQPPSSSASPSPLALGPVPFSASLVPGSTFDSTNASTSSSLSAPPEPTTTATSEGSSKASA